MKRWVLWMLLMGPVLGHAEGRFAASDAQALTAEALARTWDPSAAASAIVVRLGKERDVDGLDFLLALRGPDSALFVRKKSELLTGYARAFREANRGAPAPAIEERLVRNYDDPRIATALLGALERYESPALRDRLDTDVRDLARYRRERSRHCRFVVAPTPPPRTGPAASLPFGSQGVAGRPGVPETRVDCEGLEQRPVQELWRREAALAFVGSTDLPGVAERLTPYLRDLAATPPTAEGAERPFGSSPVSSMARSLAPIARLLRERRYLPAAPELIAILARMPGKDRTDFSAAWPLLLALGPMDLREGSETIARWIELRSRSEYSLDEAPELRIMIALLGPVLPAGQIDVGPLRDRVLANVPYATLGAYSAAFRGLEWSQRSVREPTGPALVSWVGSGNIRMVRYFISKGVALDAHDGSGATPLTQATPQHVEILKLLVEAGAKPDLPGRDGMTPFHLAVGAINPARPDVFAIVDYFLAHGADVNSRATDGRTPLHTAVMGIKPDLVRYLVAHGARVDATTADGRTPLHFVGALPWYGMSPAAGITDIVRFLVAHGAPVDARARDGSTPLHMAVRQRRLDVAEALLDGGADPNAEMADWAGEGLRPLQMARDSGNAPMEALLARHGGTANEEYLARRESKKAAAKLLEPFFRAH